MFFAFDFVIDLCYKTETLCIKVYSIATQNLYIFESLNHKSDVEIIILKMDKTFFLLPFLKCLI
jgi:hypothetical protein